MRTPPPTRAFRNCEGFSLIEIMVAALLLGIVITGATSMIGTGRSMDSAGRLRSQALRLASNALDRAPYQNAAYPIAGAPRVTTSNPSLRTESGAACTATQVDSVYATATALWVEADGGSAVGVPFQRISIKVKWTCGGPADSVMLWKRIANVE